MLMVETWSISAGSGCDCMQSRKVEIIVTTLQLGGQPWPAVESHNFDTNKLETLETWLWQNVAAESHLKTVMHLSTSVPISDGDNMFLLLQTLLQRLFKCVQCVKAGE